MSLQFFLSRIQARIDARPEPKRTVDRHTIADFITAVMDIDNEADAKQFYAGYLEWLRRHPDLKHASEDVARQNVGWCFGEGMSEARIAMWANATGASHPVFGTMKPTPEQASRAGWEAATKGAKK